MAPQGGRKVGSSALGGRHARRPGLSSATTARAAARLGHERLGDDASGLLERETVDESDLAAIGAREAATPEEAEKRRQKRGGRKDARSDSETSPRTGLRNTATGSRTVDVVTAELCGPVDKSLLQTLAALNPSVLLDRRPPSKGATLYTCPSGHQVEITYKRLARVTPPRGDATGLGLQRPRPGRTRPGPGPLGRTDRRAADVLAEDGCPDMEPYADDPGRIWSSPKRPTQVGALTVTVRGSYVTTRDLTGFGVKPEDIARAQHTWWSVERARLLGKRHLLISWSL